MNVNEEYEVEILRENNEGDGVARDINVLREKYDIKDVCAFDIYHVEAICVMERK